MTDVINNRKNRDNNQDELISEIIGQTNTD